jgi:uncharacterized protein YjbJ (UPF0337 family)
MYMNRDIIFGRLKQVRGHARLLRGELAGRELDRVVGRFMQQLGRLQEQRGVLLARFEHGLKKRVRHHDA